MGGVRKFGERCGKVCWGVERGEGKYVCGVGNVLERGGGEKNWVRWGEINGGGRGEGEGGW